MSAAATWVGYAVILLIGVGVAGVGVGFACDKIMAWREKARFRVEELARRKYAGTLLEASWWFSEDRSAMRAIQMLVEPTMAFDGCSLNTSDIRAKWRAEFAKESP
mgnify:CR=1 FL=1